MRHMVTQLAKVANNTEVNKASENFLCNCGIRGQRWYCPAGLFNPCPSDLDHRHPLQTVVTDSRASCIHGTLNGPTLTSTAKAKSSTAKQLRSYLKDAAEDLPKLSQRSWSKTKKDIKMWIKDALQNEGKKAHRHCNVLGQLPPVLNFVNINGTLITAPIEVMDVRVHQLSKLWFTSSEK